MSVRQAPAYQQGAPERPIDDDSDVEEEALANDYREQVGYEDGEDYDLDRSVSLGGGTQDLQAQLSAAATPLEYGASIEAKIQSYDSYCNLFHFILNSDGPVDIEVPSVRDMNWEKLEWDTNAGMTVLLGMGCYRRVHLPVQLLLRLPPASRLHPGAAEREHQQRGCPSAAR